MGFLKVLLIPLLILLKPFTNLYFILFFLLQFTFLIVNYYNLLILVFLIIFWMILLNDCIFLRIFIDIIDILIWKTSHGLLESHSSWLYFQIYRLLMLSIYLFLISLYERIAQRFFRVEFVEALKCLRSYFIALQLLESYITCSVDDGTPSGLSLTKLVIIVKWVIVIQR